MTVKIKNNGPPRSLRVRVLGYHAVSPSPIDGLAVSTEQFARQMRTLADKGLQGVTLQALCNRARQFDRWPDNWIAITFDDGYKDCLDYAAPILKEAGFTATVFVITDAMSGAQPISYCDPRRQFLNCGDLLQLRERGWEIGSHGRSHRRMCDLSEADQASEILESRDRLETTIGGTVVSFCYPGGQVTGTATRLVRETYQQAVISPTRPHMTLNVDWSTVDRVGIYGDNEDWLFRLKLGGLYKPARAAMLRLR
jgi:peptidoglycan/xylan/chitin deacetylase (PgdA/CDA1 family)